MRRLAATLIAPLLLAATPAVAAENGGLSDADAAAIRLAAERGKLIYAYDQAAWHGTDDMLAKMENVAASVGGWIVEGPADAPTLSFHDRDEAAPHILYVANFKAGQFSSSRVIDRKDAPTASPQQKAMIDARRAAREALVAANVMQCVQQPFNTVVLPPANPTEPTRVYFLTPQTQNGSYPIGGHYVVEVDAKGKAGQPKAFSRTCIETGRPDPGQGKPVAFFITHLLDPVPTETHVFSSLTSGFTVMVTTTENKRVWEVGGGNIQLVKSLD